MIIKEPTIEINGCQCTPAMALTIRVAIESFAMDLSTQGLGDDEHGVTMKHDYIARIDEIRELMFK